MTIGVLKEDEPESRVSLLPEHIASLVKSSIEVLVESDAGIRAFANNAAYEKGGRQNSVQSRYLSQGRYPTFHPRPKFYRISRH